MRIRFFILCLLVFFTGGLFLYPAFSAEEKGQYAENPPVIPGNKVYGGPKTEIPEGMEALYISGVRYVVPKGTRVSNDYGYNKIEPIQYYSARKFEEMGVRLSNLEKRVKTLEASVKSGEKGENSEKNPSKK